MGDDLYIAREFSNAALADISVMRAMEQRQSSDSIEQMSVKLAQLQSGAKRLRARAIYQSAQIVIDGLNPTSTSEDNFNIRLSALSNLVTQYADGLSEVENAQIQDILEHTDGANIEGEPTSEDKQVLAKQTLTDLMLLARGGEITALQDLMDYDPKAAPKPELETTPEIAAQTTTVQQKSVLAKPKLAPQIPLEYVLRDAIQDALSIARISGKTISISYDVGQEHIGEDDITSLERRLCEGLRALILQSLPQDGVGHIDINLQGKDMVICSKHKKPRLLPEDLKTRDTANGCEITLPLIAKTQIPSPAAPKPLAETHIEASEQNSEPVAPRPMITPETEDQLRTQLGALMDGKDIHAEPHMFALDMQNFNEQALHMEDNIIVMTDGAANKTTKRDADTDEIGVGV